MCEGAACSCDAKHASVSLSASRGHHGYAGHLLTPVIVPCDAFLLLRTGICKECICRTGICLLSRRPCRRGTCPYDACALHLHYAEFCVTFAGAGCTPEWDKERILERCAHYVVQMHASCDAWSMAGWEEERPETFAASVPLRRMAVDWSWLTPCCPS